MMVMMMMMMMMMTMMTEVMTTMEVHLKQLWQTTTRMRRRIP